MGGAAGQAASSANNPIQQQLAQLASAPYGDNPLFKNLIQDSGKLEAILKPINPAAQKALSENNQYKISPHRNIKAKVWWKSLNIPGTFLRLFSLQLSFCRNKNRF